MDDSDLDFSHLCSRVLKRVKRKETRGSADDKQAGKGGGSASLSPRRNPPKRRKKDIKDETQPGDVSQPVRVAPGSGKAKDAVIRRMQQFKRAHPERLLHADAVQPTLAESGGHGPNAAEIQQAGDVSSDEAVALQLQRELDREARAAVDVEDGGLFFCQLCQKNLSTMSPQLRTQHINRCLDASETDAPSASTHPRLHIPECPICGKSFKSEKSRSNHLKRCSTDMGVSANDLLQALRRQASETASDIPNDQSRQTGATKRNNGVPAKKKRRRKGQMDEDTMVALALSRSLLEQEKEKEREMEEEREIQAQISSCAGTGAPVLHRRPPAGKGRGKRRKGGSPIHPPLLLIQDPQTALNRLQERVSSLLLRSRSPSPPTPPRSPSALPTNSRAPLWLKSALHGGGPGSEEFYTSELGNFIQPLVPPKKEMVETSPEDPPPAGTSEATQEKRLDQSPAQHRSAPSPLTVCSGTSGSQALQDLMELAEEGMTLTQYGPTTATDKDDAVNELPASGFVPETQDNRTLNTASVCVSRLTSDLSCMVNNPQLSDVQLQVDGGDVFYTHSFMLYTRCPLLANMVHDLGFGVQEEGLPIAQRVLLGDIPGPAVLALLQYLYTARCPLTHTLLSHVQQLADRFRLKELQQQCEEYSRSGEKNPRGDSSDTFSAQEPHTEDHEDQNLAESRFLELLQSMWQHEDSEGEDESQEKEERGAQVEAEREDGELKEDRVDEEELDEIYEFAATQRKMETMLENTTETEEEGDAIKSIEKEKEKDGENETESPTSFHSNEQGVDGTVAAVVTRPEEIHQNQNTDTGTLQTHLPSESDGHRNPDASLDKSYERLFSQSVGDYMEPSQTPAACQQQHYKSHTLQQNTPVFRPSCVSEMIDLSVSPSPSSGVSGDSSFPVPGVSPGLDKGEDVGRAEMSSSCPRRNLSSSPKSHSKQVELIVLSDSSEEMDDGIDYVTATTKQPPGGDVLSPPPLSNSPLEPSCKTKKQNSSTSGSQENTSKQVKPCKQVIDTEPVKLDQSENRSPGTANQSVFDGSAEISWLIPATPVPVMRSSSSQTCVSMRRTQLFPKSCSSSSSSANFSSSTASAHLASTSDGCLGRKPEPLSKLQSNCQRFSKEQSSTDMEHNLGCQTPQHHLSLSQVPSELPSSIISGRPVQSVPQPSSSTPLHLDSSFKRQVPFSSPLVSKCEINNRECNNRDNHNFSLNQGKGGMLSLQLSQSESSPSPSKMPEKNIVSLQHGSLNQSPESISCGHPEMSRDNKDKRLEQTEVEDKNHNIEEVLDVAESSPQACFYDLDEPPIAFDDSWGLDGGVGSQKPRFSLRLDSSGGSVSPSGNDSRRHMAGPHTTTPLAPGAHNKTPELSPGPFNHSLPDPDMWDDWEENEEEPLPLSQRLAPPSVKRVAELKTPVACRNKNKGPLVPITPMPSFSDMDTPELKNRLNRFGVRPLPKKQMVMKLREIHQYTHQLQSSESEEEAPPPRHPLPASISRSAQLSFKQPTAPPAASPTKLQPADDDELLSASQSSTTSSTAESDRSNPEICISDDEDSEVEGITASQAVVREKDKLLAVRRFILSDPNLYGRVLQYQPLPLAELQASLKAAGIRLGAAKLLDFLDSQCITFSTAKQGQGATSRRKGRRKAVASGPGDAARRGRKKTAKPHGGAV